MSGHSKWATTKHKKAAVDAKRAKVFTKLANLITISARDGKSGDPNFNPSLRMAIDNAKAASMPKENIDRAIQRGAGGGDAVKIEEVIYEAYGPHAVAMLIECLTDNRNRVISSIKAILNKYSGSIAGVGSVSYQFKKMGEISFDATKSSIKGEDLEMLIIESGADDFDSEENLYILRTNFSDLINVKKFLAEKGVAIDSAEVIEVAASPIELSEEKVEMVMNLVDALEELDDVSTVYTNLA